MQEAAWKAAFARRNIYVEENDESDGRGTVDGCRCICYRCVEGQGFSELGSERRSEDTHGLTLVA
jgi:hypothetical protein